MPIEASEPSVISATYDKWAFEFQTRGFGVTGDKVSCAATLVKYRVLEDGTGEISPLASDRVSLSIPDLYAFAATDPVVAAAMNALIAAVSHIAEVQGKL